MDNLLINATEITPKICFDYINKTFEISGESRPENVKDFYEPILTWIDNFFKSNNNNTLSKFDIKLEYFNSSSAKFLLTLLKNLGVFYKSGTKIEINWYYEEGDDDMKEAGEQMSEMAKIPFNLIETDEL